MVTKQADLGGFLWMQTDSSGHPASWLNESQTVLAGFTGIECQSPKRSLLLWGTRGREFESRRLDHFIQPSRVFQPKKPDSLHCVH